ncbi:hypothetical protein NV379_02585 [Paenibacillus sp. N1-5-1-14]|uniref:hypothetical protein n=1 Tax=Paenibacillus radicibacter TaxID=2972488 RepID=UPI002158FE72|nr:hypothetical protein [Paenibacillus radicibacter]MCR8641533.1 hypothetical protein [Paenibacillus radicibacter]
MVGFISLKLESRPPKFFIIYNKCHTGTLFMGERLDVMSTKRKVESQQNAIKQRQSCIKCKKEKPIAQYYNSKSPMFDGKITICKDCIKLMIDYKNMDSIYTILQQMDIKFDTFYWEKSLESKTDTFARYVTMANSFPQFDGTSWKDSVFDNDKTSVEVNKSDDEFPSKKNYDISQLKSKYGYGYPDDEYYLFEDKYQQLKTSFQLLTTMHEEYFREFCVNKVKETLAKAKGNFKEAKEWAAMVKDVAEAGKLKPSQMSKADLSGGLDTFGQLARLVEENNEIMSLLPLFTEQPKDKVDVTLWCYINYVRDLKGLPECEYKEIYAFYDKKKEDYENQMSDNSFNSEEVDANG